MRVPYIACMAASDNDIVQLVTTRDKARDEFFASRDPGNLTSIQKQAFQYRDMAYLLLFKAAQMELDAELELRALLKAEKLPHD